MGTNVNTEEYQVGDTIYGACSLFDKKAGGSLAEYCVVNVSSIAKRTKDMEEREWTYGQCASLNIAYITSLQSLRLGNVTHETDNSQKAVLVIGASGGCGIAALQLCRAMAVGRIVAICSGRNADFVRNAAGEREATEEDDTGSASTTSSGSSIKVVDYTNQEALKSFMEENVGKFDCIVDAATGSGKGEEYWSASIPLLKKKTAGGGDGDGKSAPGGKYVALNGSAWKWTRAMFGMQSEDQVIIMAQPNTTDLELLPKLLDRINVKPIVIEMPFTEHGLKDGFDMLKGRRTKGKIVFEINS